MGQLLRNNHNVYILGAGFSREAGLPLIHDFLSQMRDSYDWLLQQHRDREALAVNEVLKFRLAAASAAYWVNLDLENIEELFSLAFANSDGIATAMQLAIAATLDYARKMKGALRSRLEVRDSNGLFKNDRWPDWIKRSTTPINLNGIGSYEIGNYALHVAKLLGMLKDGKPQGENTFITFNYDTLLEDALTELKLPMVYGSRIDVPPSTKTQINLPSVPNRPAVVEQETLREPIPVFKLHGSVNWARTGNKDDGMRVFGSYDECVKSEMMPELVPPTWKKVFENEIESVWEDAIDKLNTATRIIIIGFSMPPTDMHFKYLLAAGLKKNISLRQVLFVNPDSNNELKPRVEKMLRQAYVDSGRIAFAKAELGRFTGSEPSSNMGLHQLGRPTEYGLQYNVYSQT